MLTLKQKKEVVEKLSDKIKNQTALIFTDFSGLEVGELQELRSQLNQVDAEYKVAKKTLIKRALDQVKIDIDINKFNSSVGLVMGFEDPVLPNKIVSQFSKTHKDLDILGGLMNKEFISSEKVKQLANIPPREVLLAKIVGSIKAPLSGLCSVLQGNTRKLVGVLSAINNK